MNTKNIFSVRIIPFVVISLAMVLLYALYFIYYIPKQESQVEQRTFRILKEVAKNMNDKLDYYDAHFNNYSFFYVIKHLTDDDSNHLDDSVKQELKKSIDNNNQVTKLIDNLDKSIKTEKGTLNEAHTELGMYEDIFQFKFIIKINKGNYEKGFKELLDSVGIDSVLKYLGLDSSKIANPHQSIDDASVNTTEIQDNTKSRYSSSVHYVPMNTFMEHLKFDKLLNNIVLFDTSIIYNTSLDVIQDITNPGMLADTVKKTQGGLIRKINIRGEKNHVMVLPIDFLSNRLYLAGFITETDFSQKTRHINSQFLIMLAGIFLLLLFSMPILKIFLVSRKEQLHARDCTAGTFSLIIVTGFSILIILSAMKHYVVDRHNLSKRIENISEKLYYNVISDFESIKTLYQGIIEPEYASEQFYKIIYPVIITFQSFNTSNNTPAESKNRFDSLYPGCTPEKIRNYWNTSDEEREVFDSLYFELSFDGDKPFRDIPADYQKHGLPLNEIFLINDNGDIVKAVTSTGLSSLVPSNLEKRRYFSNLKEESGNSWTYNIHYSTQRYYIESLKSYNSGKKEVAFSFRLPQKTSDNFGVNIMAITSPLPSLYSQVLPEDVSFMIINKEGDVLFHSTKSKNLHENFLAECDENEQLEGLMRHRVTDIISIDYNEKNWLARVHPIEDTPLFHITLIDLQYTTNKNARILIYTFYFMLATFILILIGTGIIQLGKPNKNKSLSKQWLFYWLQFNEENKVYYFQLLIMQAAILLFQISGIFINDKPVTMFIYQMVFIVISVYVALSILKYNKNTKPDKGSTTLALPQIILILVMLILTGILIYLNQKLIMLLPFVLLIFLILLTEKLKRIDKIPFRGYSPRTIFHIYVFIWLLGISAIPALQYYQSVKKQEEDLWKRNKLEHIAMRNLALEHEYKYEYEKEVEKEGWYKRIIGNNLDFLKIDYISLAEINSDRSAENDKCELSPADRYYARLPDPLTKGNHLIGLLKNSSTHMEWYRESVNDSIICRRVNDNKLVYSQPGYDKYISVTQNGSIKLGTGRWLLYFSIPILLVISSLWYLFKYVSRFILRTITADWEEPERTPWENIIGSDNIKQILLCSPFGDDYLEKTRTQIKNKSGSGKNQKNPDFIVGDLKEIIKKLEFPFYQNAAIIWIKGTGKLIKEPETFGNHLLDLYKLTADNKAKLIIEIPFGLDYIREYYDDLLKESAPEAKAVIKSNISKTDELFSSFYIYTGKYIPEETDAISTLPDSTQSVKSRKDEERQQASYYSLESSYRYIWNNLTNLEKLTLTDLSADGMINYKNKQSIDQLILKGLINPKPYTISRNSFQRFLINDIDPAEIKQIQDKLGKHGKWHNNRYLILLVIIPLIIFIFISQGTSVDRVFTITTGGLAALAGIMRLFDTNIFTQSHGSN